MERTISQRELRNDNAEIVRALESGDSFIVTRNGVAVGRLTPIARRSFVPVAELLAGAALLPPIDYATFRSDIDRSIDQDSNPRG